MQTSGSSSSTGSASSSTLPHPLRPYYVAPPIDSDWTFGPTLSSSSKSTTNSRSSIPSSSSYNSSSSSTQPSFKLTTLNRYEQSSSSLMKEFKEGRASLSDLTPLEGIKSFLTTSLLTFASTALVMPFEVGKTLAQCQWVPRDGIDPIVWGNSNDVVEEEVVELDDEAEAEAYFSDLQARGGSTSFLPPRESNQRPVSPSGYQKRSGVSDEALGTKPEWVMPVVVQGGVWDMMKTVGRWKGEGWSSLWKGQVTTCILDAATSSIQPVLQTTFTLLFFPSSSPLYALSGLPLIHSPHPVPLLFFATFSHALTTLALSPLDLIRTRLIVQSAQPRHRKYSGPIDAFQTILAEEGGLSTMYLHSNLLIPTLLEGILRPLIHLSTPLIISRLLFIEPSSSPLTFGLAELVLGSIGLLITIPIETVRKRLQLQSRAEFVRGGKPGGTGRAWRSCVETRPNSYAGVVEAVYRILTEETGSIPRRRRKSRGEKEREREKEETKEDLGVIGLGMQNGLRQLYRGLGMGVGANVVVFVLGLVAGNESSSGWEEM